MNALSENYDNCLGSLISYKLFTIIIKKYYFFTI